MTPTGPTGTPTGPAGTPTGRAGINVLIVDDSAVVRQVLTAVLNAAPPIHVIGAAPDPIFAMERMNRNWPDVIVLDLEMPRMDGLTFLKQIMAVRPTPVVICSTLTERGATIAMDAMSAGAVAVVTKPTSGLKQFLEQDSGELIHAVRSAAAGNIRQLKATTITAANTTRTTTHNAAPGTPTPRTSSLHHTTDRLVAIGTSTGGTQALEIVLRALPRLNLGIVIVQHMPEKFTAAFATRLNNLCEFDVIEASDTDRILPGRILIAPGGRHMSVHRNGAQYNVRVYDSERVNRHKPSVDVLFESVARTAGHNALGVIMTGMGNDGAQGILQMHNAGAQTIGQDEQTCVVYGMPKVAHDLGALDQQVPLPAISQIIRTFAAQR